MATKKGRPALTSLVDMMPTKNAPAASPSEKAALKDAPAHNVKVDGGKGTDRVSITVRMTPAERKALRQIALDNDTTVQTLVEEGIRDLLNRYGVKL